MAKSPNRTRELLHRSFNRLIVLVAGLCILAYAVSLETTPPADKRGKSKSGDDEDDAISPEGNVVDAASEAGRFGIWCLAVKQSGLVETLERAGPFTVFAPTDEAFGALGEKLDDLLADTDQLRTVVQSHVCEGRYSAADLGTTTELTTLAGSTIAVSPEDGVAVNDISVVEADLSATNGIVHGIAGILTA